VTTKARCRPRFRPVLHPVPPVFRCQAYLEADYFLAKTESVGTPGGVTDGGVFNPADPTNPVVHTSVLPANHPDNPTGVNRTLGLLTTDLGGRNQRTKSEVTRVVGGVTGDISGWNYDVGAAYLESKLRSQRTGTTGKRPKVPANARVLLLFSRRLRGNVIARKCRSAQTAPVV
jgi:hypothetical protein